MKPNKFNFKPGKIVFWVLVTAVCCGLAIAGVGSGWCDSVAPEVARKVAEQQMRLHVELYGHWNHSTTPSVAEVQEVRHAGRTVAYNCRVVPSGHVLVAVDDDFSPVLLYSATSSFDPGRMDNPNAIESWIVPELDHRVGKLETGRRAISGFDSLSRGAVDASSDRRIRKAWEYYTQAESLIDTDRNGRSTADGARGAAAVAVGPLLETAWGQMEPYNLMAPAGDDCDHALNGCVPTAWAQLMRYWAWPKKGTGSVNYEWNAQTLSIDFDSEEIEYDWGNMPRELSVDSSLAEKEAVANLIHHVGLASETEFGCDASYTDPYADDILPEFFNYRLIYGFDSEGYLGAHDRLFSSYTDDQWFTLFKNELDADPPRPIVLSIFSDIGGHEVITDGYQSGLTDLIHINFGLDGNYDGFYDITQPITANDVDWEANSQIIVTGIEPDNEPPIIAPVTDKTVAEGAAVTLDVSAVDPEEMGDVTYRWTQTAGAAVVLTGADSARATFTAPEVNSTTTLQFELRATDANRAYAVDTVTVTVSNQSSSSDSGGSGGGGCFISAVAH